jgi:hypothetical protein
MILRVRWRVWLASRVGMCQTTRMYDISFSVAIPLRPTHGAFCTSLSEMNGSKGGAFASPASGGRQS